MIGRSFSSPDLPIVLLAAMLTQACAPGTSSSIAVGQHHDVAIIDVAVPDTLASTVSTVEVTSHDADLSRDETGTPWDETSAEDSDATTLTGVAAVCERWNADRADLREGAWSGTVASCAPGTLLEPGPTNTLRQVNLYRWLAGLPAVAAAADLNVAAQACSLAMDANHAITHDIPASWTCYSELGASAAAVSNIATTAAVYAIDLYMSDPGNEDTLGHRRWLLANSLGPIGIGSTSGYSCLNVIGGDGHAGRTWTAWPPEGIVPYGALVQGGNGGRMSIDYNGWSIQSDAIDLGRLDVAVARDGEAVPVTTSMLLRGYGSTSAIKIMPDGWRTEPGHTYHVELTGLAQPISYDVVVVDCD